MGSGSWLIGFIQRGLRLGIQRCLAHFHVSRAIRAIGFLQLVHVETQTNQFAVDEL